MLIGTSALGFVLFQIFSVKQVLQQRSILSLGLGKDYPPTTALGCGSWLVCLEVVAEDVAKVATISTKLEFWPELFPLLTIFKPLKLGAHAHACTHTDTHSLTHTHTDTHSLTHTHTHTHLHTRTHTHTHTHSHTHTHTHTLIHTLTNSPPHTHTRSNSKVMQLITTTRKCFKPK